MFKYICRYPVNSPGIQIIVRRKRNRLLIDIRIEPVEYIIKIQIPKILFTPVRKEKIISPIPHRQQILSV